ncbi:hypothetical protein, partial [Acinetobacter pittii]
LLNCLFWALGCEVRFEEDWPELDTVVLIEFSINNKIYKVKRDSQAIHLQEDDEQWATYEKITGSYLDRLNSILNFNVLLKNSKAKKLSKVPPAFYFASTYIEQMSGWNEIWNSFNNLGQFDKNNKFELSKYLCGVLNKNYYDNKLNQNFYELKNFDISKEILKTNEVSDYFRSKRAISPQIDLQDKIKNSARSVVMAERKILEKKNEYINISSRMAAIDNELQIIQVAIGEIEQDYNYSIENIETTSIFCPTCGVEHKNDLVNRFSLIHDQNRLMEQIKNLQNEKSVLINKSYNLTNSIDSFYQEIEGAFKEESFNEDINQLFISKSLIPGLEEKVASDNREFRANTKEIRKIRNENKIIENSNLEEIEKDVVEYFNSLCTDLNIKMYLKHNLYDILNYYSGGANQVKAMLAKRLTILNSIYSHAELSTPPFIIDSPRQQDIDSDNYHNMLNILISNTPDDVQLIIAAVQNNFIDSIKGNFEEINLESTLLTAEEYELANFLISHS